MNRQPFAARVWGSCYRTWFPYDDNSHGRSRHRKRAKRRSAKRERMKTRTEIRVQDHD